jgi:hypothetical protein
MDLTHAELILKHALDKHEDAAEAVNVIYEETAEKINAEGPSRARKVCEAILNGEVEP